MNGELALVAALAAHGGRWLRSDDPGPSPNLSQGNSSFQHVGTFSAEMPPRGLLRRTSTLVSPEQWLAALRDGGVHDLELITETPPSGPLPPHLASAFSNAGTWALLATAATARSVWTIDWHARDPNGPPTKGWALTARIASQPPLPTPGIGVGDARDRLRESLSAVRNFAQSTDDLAQWTAWFAKAEALLNDPDPTAPYHRDLLPTDAALPRRQLAAAVVQGWVFGGMGSWNDAQLIDPTAQREYHRVGASLYASLLAALAAATNGA